MNNLFKRNREKLFNILNDGDCAILFASEAPVKRGDEKYLFTPDRNFYYLTGIDREELILVMEKSNGVGRATLFIPPDNGQMARWIGANLTKEEAMEISAIEDIKFLEEFKVCDWKRLFLDKKRVDLKENETESYFKTVVEADIEDLFPVMTSLRLIKEKEEIELVEKAIEITRLGILEMMKNAKADIMEYEHEAYFDFILRKNGVKDKAFQTIAAAGVNGTTLHYVENNSVAKDGDLILVDAGAQVGYYNGDITRTFPVNGKFSEKQKLVYNIVLGGQKLVMDNIKEGITIVELNDMLKEYYYIKLKEIGLVETKEDVFNYYFHNVGHFLGAETHDVGDRTEKLRENMIFTVEPGLYIKEWEVGIRIEDDVIVTKDGYRNLSEKMIKTVEEIESFMVNSNDGNGVI